MNAAGAHPNIVQLHGYFAAGTAGSNGENSLVLELCTGGELFAQVERDGALPEARSRRYFTGIAAGVAHLHSCGVCHRDLKLENVLLGGPSADEPKICDLGLAHVFKRTSITPGKRAHVLQSTRPPAARRSRSAPFVATRRAPSGAHNAGPT